VPHVAGDGPWARRIRLASWGLILLGISLIMQALPLGDALQRGRGAIEGLGLRGAILYILIYVLATVLMLPGSVLTLAAGLIFGLVRGTIVVSLGSTLGAAAAFLIARHVVRARVSSALRRRPRLDAVDRAVGERGWRVVVLLRLSPLVPFNLQNYLYGITSMRFWPCILASWIAMLPGTLLYVYLGSAVGAAALGGERQREPLEWAILGVGLLATAAVSVYLARLARDAIRRTTDIAAAAGEDAPAPRRRGAPWLAAAAGLLLTGAGVSAQASKSELRAWAGALMGPPMVTMVEAYAAAPPGPAFDHGTLDALLRAHVTREGLVDYAGLLAERSRLEAYLEALAQAPFADLGRDEKLALLINAYNAFTLKLVLDHWRQGELRSIKDIDRPWDQVRWRVGASTWSLNQIEHEQVRPKFHEPRIHFALVCAARGCPRLRDEAYDAARLESQLEDQARRTHADPRFLAFDAQAGVVRLSRLYDWYAGDFVQTGGSAVGYAARYAPELRRALDSGRTPRVEWIEYDWSLNRTPP
jgi:uncharacterized membrane protein YdjX (TVP38/TMEM64 family)